MLWAFFIDTYVFYIPTIIQLDVGTYKINPHATSTLANITLNGHVLCIVYVYYTFLRHLAGKLRPLYMIMFKNK